MNEKTSSNESDSIGEGVRAKLAELEAELAEAKDERARGVVDLEPGDYWLTSVGDGKGRAIVTLERRLLIEQKGGGWADLNMPVYPWTIEPRSEAVPSLPAVDSPEDLTPEQWRWVARATKVSLADYPWENTTIHIHELADRLEREQAAKAEHDQLIEHLAEVIVRADDDLAGGYSDAPSAYIDVARALLYDPTITITRKEVKE